MPATISPCRRPKVTVEPRDDADTYIVRCHVTGCGFQYPQDLQFHALKSDADGQATMHRRAHRDAVPNVPVERTGAGFTALCETCDAGKYLAGRSEADEWVAHHLITTHGLVA